MKRPPLLSALCALAAVPSFATVLVNEPFSSADYAAGSFKSLANAAPVSANVGFSADRGWQASRTGVVFVHASGLGFDRQRTGFAGTGLSAGWNYGNNSQDGGRGVSRQLASGAFPTSGTFFFRALYRESTGAIWRGQWLRRVGFQLLAFNGQGHEDTGETRERYWNLVPSSGPSFVVRRRTDSSSYAEFVLKDASATLVDEVEQGTTYLFLAKIEIGAGANGNDLASALCVPVADWDWNGRDEPDWTLVRADTGFSLATAQTPDMLTLYGAYETGSVPVAFDEIMLATKLSEAVPNTHPGLVIIVR